ncbi:hypothetical protein GW17_00045609 [Ensete ventricosum]|nr:hypothetical protein GW17_00045609 [Ensete ventricosum]
MAVVENSHRFVRRKALINIIEGGRSTLKRSAAPARKSEGECNTEGRSCLTHECSSSNEGVLLGAENVLAAASAATDYSKRTAQRLQQEGELLLFRSHLTIGSGLRMAPFLASVMVLDCQHS